jgi:hypothetical protein
MIFDMNEKNFDSYLNTLYHEGGKSVDEIERLKSAWLSERQHRTAMQQEQLIAYRDDMLASVQLEINAIKHSLQDGYPDEYECGRLDSLFNVKDIIHKAFERALERTESNV